MSANYSLLALQNSHMKAFCSASMLYLALSFDDNFKISFSSVRFSAVSLYRGTFVIQNVNASSVLFDSLKHIKPV